MNWSTACPDWERRIVAGESLIPLAPLFPDEAERGLSVFRSLRISDVPGKPTLGEAGRKWVFDFVAAIFGAYDPESERQLIREFLLVVSKKNSKSTIAAGVMLTVLILNARHSAEFLILAPTKEIADNSFDPAADMADTLNKELERDGAQPLFRIYRREKRIVHLGTKAELKVIAADTDTVGGTKATVVLVDELWVFGKRPGAMSMFREATGGLAARPEGFVVYLTTMSDEAPAGEFKSKLLRARKVRDGEIEDKRLLPVIYEYPPAMLKAKAFRDPANFYITNPNLGASVDEEFLREKFAEAEQNGEAHLLDFSAKHLNVEIGIGLKSDNWAGAEFWAEQAEPGMDLDAVLTRSEVVVVGIDGGGLDDLLGLAVLGRCRETRRWLHWGRAWAHPTVLQRRVSEAPKLRDFAAAGDLRIVGRIGEDIAEVVEIVTTVEASGLLPEKHGIGLDPAGIGALLDALSEAGIGGDVVVGVSQGWRLGGAIKTAERKLAEGALMHGGSALMAWSVGNAKVEPRGNSILITKQASGTAKIDPLMALFNAVHLMGLQPAAAPVFAARAMIG